MSDRETIPVPACSQRAAEVMARYAGFRTVLSAWVAAVLGGLAS